jgi:hypothetical protein
MASNIQQVLSFVATAAYTGEAIDCSQCSTVGLQCVGTGLSAVDGTIKLQHSNDGVTWADVAAATTVAASGTAYMIAATVAPYVYYRAVWAKGANAAGTVAVNIIGKASR